jgi:hypothetical protein
MQVPFIVVSHFTVVSLVGNEIRGLHGDACSGCDHLGYVVQYMG